MFSANSINRWLLKKFSSVAMLRYGLMQAATAAGYMTLMNILNIHNIFVAVVGFALAISSMGFCMANIMGLAMQAHGERAGTAAGLLGFSNSIGGAIAAPITGAIFGLTMAGVTTFMSILIIIAVAIGLFAMRNEKGVIH